MTHQEFIEKCKQVVATDQQTSVDNVFVTWSCKTLQNSKAILGTTMNYSYYECTMNGDRKEIYVDKYEKHNQILVPIIE